MWVALVRPRPVLSTGPNVFRLLPLTCIALLADTLTLRSFTTLRKTCTGFELMISDVLIWIWALCLIPGPLMAGVRRPRWVVSVMVVLHVLLPLESPTWLMMCWAFPWPNLILPAVPIAIANACLQQALGLAMNMNPVRWILLPSFAWIVASLVWLLWTRGILLLLISKLQRLNLLTLVLVRSAENVLMARLGVHGRMGLVGACGVACEC